MNEFTLLGFIGKLAEMTVHAHEITKVSLTEAARVVQKEAKESLGEYQTETGQFGPWPELADSTKVNRLALGYTENNPGLREGEMRDSIEVTVKVDGFTGTADIGSDDDKLVYFELGTEHQPPRSVLGGALFREKDRVLSVIGSSAFGTLIGDEVFQGGIPIIEK
jgi:hypothetical protein